MSPKHRGKKRRYRGKTTVQPAPKAKIVAKPKHYYEEHDEDLEHEGEDRSWGEKGERPKPPRPRLRIGQSSD